MLKSRFYKRLNFLIICFLFTLSLHAQNGYIITNSDSLITGYIRHQYNFMDGRAEVEVWKTKKDKNPDTYPGTAIKEYAIKKDTFKIFRNYYPYKEGTFSVPYLEARVVFTGRLNLYIASGLYDDVQFTYSPATGIAPYYTSQSVYIIENENGEILAIDPDDMIEDLNYFLDFNLYAKKLNKKKFKYFHIPALVQLYNQE